MPKAAAGRRGAFSSLCWSLSCRLLLYIDRCLYIVLFKIVESRHKKFIKKDFVIKNVMDFFQIPVYNEEWQIFKKKEHSCG